MNEPNDNPVSQQAPAEVSESQVLNGGIEIEVVKIDASSERVKVRQLPISLIGEWGRNQGSENEAYLIELLCDKVDRTTAFHLQNARMTEMRVLQVLQQAPFEQIEAIEKRLKAIRDEIAALEAKPRWSDTITHESISQVREIGERLNKKKYVDQMERTRAGSKAILDLLLKSAAPNSSSPSPSSAKSPSET